MRPGIIHRISHWVIAHARLVLGLGALVTLFFAAQLPRLELDPSAEGIMVEEDPARRYYDQIKDVFGSDSIIAIAIHRDDTIFRTPTLATIKAMAAELEKLDGVERVFSLATTDNLANCEEGLKPGPLYTTPPDTPEALAEARRQALANPVFLDNLVSADGRTAGIIVFVTTRSITRGSLSRRLRDALEQQAPLAPGLLTDLLYSPTFAAALPWALPPTVLDDGDGSPRALERAVERHPDAVGRAALELLRRSPSLRRTAIREAPAASRQGIADLVGRVDDILRAHQEPGQAIYQVGNPVMKVMGVRNQRHDLTSLLPCALGVVAVVLFLAFRSGRGVLIPLGTVALSVVWTLGLMAFLGLPLTVITTIVGPLLVAVGNCYSMHVLVHYYQLAGQERERRALAERALASCYLPVLLAGATTVVGLLSVALSHLSSIREFGLFSSFGIFCALVISLTVSPALLRYLPPPRAEGAEDGSRTRHATLTERFLRAVGRLDVQHGGAIALAGCLLVAAAIVGCFLVRVDTDYLGFFRRTDPVRVNSQRMHRELSGAVPFSVVVDARRWPGADADGDSEWGPFAHPTLLRFLLDLQRHMAELQLGEGGNRRRALDKTTSFADQVKLMHQGYTGDRSRGLPETRAEVESLLDVFYKREASDKYVSADLAQANIFVRTASSSSHDLGSVVAAIERYARNHAPQGVDVTVTGETVLILRAADEIALGQVRSLGLAFVVIFTIMGILFTSAKAGLLSILPNAIPIVGTFGLMGWLGVSLNAGTSMVASVALGIAVDDTIHYMTGFNREMRRLGDQTRAILTTLFLRGKAIVFTSVALFCGFMVLTASRFEPNVAFGYLTALAMVTALFGDIAVLPVLLRRVELVTLWDLLAARLPSDPRDWRGVLRGLTLAEARRVVLCGAGRTARQGTRILLHGADRARAHPVWAQPDGGRRLFVVLAGQVELRAGAADQQRVVATVGPGELFGEAVLSPGDPLPPDAVAVQDTELLAFHEGSLRRLRRRFPRAAARFLGNLAALLGERFRQAVAAAATTAQPSTAPATSRPVQYPLFDGLRARQRSLICSTGEARTYAEGEPILLRSEAGGEMLAILTGQVEIAAGTTGSPGPPVCILGEGGLFVAGLADATAARVTARALAPTQVLVLTTDLLDRLRARSARTAAALALRLVEALLRQLDRLAS